MAWWISASANKRHQQFAGEPCFGAFVVVFRKVPESRQQIEALESRFDLQAGAVPPEHLRDVEGHFGKFVNTMT